MKNIYSIAIALLFSTTLWAQAPQKMSYQAVIRNSSNALITSTPVGMRISILQGTTSGTVAYSETQTQSTNANGLVSLEIGSGAVITGTFSAINWGAGPYFIKTETDPTGGTAYTISGTSELMSVPYALHAKTAESITGGITETDPIFIASPAYGITTATISYWNNKLDAEVDGSITNELQTLRISNDTMYLSNGGFAKLPAGFDGNYNSLTNKPTAVSSFTNDAGYLTSFNEVDGSITNELQTLRISNDTIYLSNGGFAKIPATNAWSVNGNSGTVDGTNFIGSTDNVPLNFKVNNQPSGRIDYTMQNTSLGYRSYTTTTPDAHNSAFGAYSLENSNGAYNTAMGSYAYKKHNIGNYNTIIGSQAGENNITGSSNVFIGYAAGYNETGSNKLYITNHPTNMPLIYGDFASGNLGLGTTNPGAKLEVDGNIKIVDGTQAAGKILTSDATGLATWQAKESKAYGMIYRINAFDIPIISTWTDLPLDGGESNLINVVHSTTVTPERITVSVSGTYLIQYVIHYRRQNFPHHGVSRLIKNGSNEILGSYTIASPISGDGNEEDPLSTQIITTLTADDYINLQVATNYNVVNEVDSYVGPDLPAPTTKVSVSITITKIGD